MPGGLFSWHSRWACMRRQNKGAWILSTGDIRGLGRRRVARVDGAWKSAWLIVSLATGCATGAPVRHEGPSPAPATATVCPFGPSADLYRSSLVARPSKDPFALQLKAELDRWMKKLGQSALVYDARLDQVAYDVARLSAEQNVPPASVVTFLVAHYGVVEPQPNMILMSGEHGAEASAVADLGRQVSDIHTASTWRQVGIGIWRAGSAWSAALAFQEHNLTLDPVPRRLA